VAAWHGIFKEASGGLIEDCAPQRIRPFDKEGDLSLHGFPPLFEKGEREIFGKHHAQLFGQLLDRNGR
jgi:hypothetical protein